MIKTLRITSVAAAILAVIFFVFSVVFGVRSDEGIEEFLASPGAIENSRKASGNQDKKSESQISPLVEQAVAFALYLNPPEPKETPTIRETTSVAATALPVTPKFKVVGISYYEGRPELSMALINEPGKDPHWVRQSSNVGHLVIEQIKDNLVIVRGTKGTFEIAVEERPQISLLEGGGSVSREAVGGKSEVGIERSDSVSSGARITRTRSRAPQRRISPEQDARYEELVDQLRAIQRSFKSDKTDSGPNAEQKAALMEQLISGFKSSRLSAEEAKKLGDLGRKLKDDSGDPNLSLPAQEAGAKVEASPRK